MTQKKTIDPDTWGDFLSGFTTRNRGRRARFEIYGSGGSFKEEAQEGVFEGAAMDGRSVKIDRSYEAHGTTHQMSDDVHDIHGIEAQLDTDGSEDVLAFYDHQGNMTALHFESRVDGDS